VSELDRNARAGRSLLYGLSAGHGVKHFGQAALLVIIPEMRAALSLTDVAVGWLLGARDAASGVANVPAGLWSDMYRHRIPLLLMISMGSVGAAYLMIGLSSGYWLTLLAMILFGAGTSLWHAPAFSELALRYPSRVGFAMAAHSTGAQIGNTAGPVIVGVMLGGVSVLGIEWAGFGWRTVSLLLFTPAPLTIAAIAIGFRGGAPTKTARSLAAYRQATIRLLSDPAVLAQVLLHAIRGAAHNSIGLFLVIYMAEELDYNGLLVGLHVSLLTLAGIVSTPLLGIASDRFGRRIVSTVSFGAIGVLVVGFLWSDEGWAFAINMTLLGVFIFSIMPVIVASAMDSAASGSEGTSVAALFAGGALISAVAPPIAGLVNTSYGFDGVVIFVAGLAAAGTLISLFAPRRRRVVA
jgi:FSR family fosmidomycin resistance protein-like MFS transporter